MNEQPETLIIEAPPAPEPGEDHQLKAAIEAIVYVAEQPVNPAQIAAALAQPPEKIQALLEELIAEFGGPAHGVMIREVAGGYQMTTKPEHHDSIRAFVRQLKPPLKLSLAALETLAVIAYKQPVTSPEIQEIRGVQGAGVLKTLLDRKLIAAAGRKNVVGRPILYRTTKDFLVQFGLKDLSELPTLKEFEELRRLGFVDEPAAAAAEPASEAAAEPASEVAAEPATEAAAEPLSETAAEPASEVAAEPATEVAAEPATEVAAEPATPQEPEPQTGENES